VSLMKNKDILSRNKIQRGFTLVEILITVAIIALITNVATVQYQNASNKAKISKAKADLEAMGSAIEQIEEDTDNYIPELSYLDDKLPPDPSFSPWWGPYVSSLSLKDPWGNDYFYYYWLTNEEYNSIPKDPSWNISGGTEDKGFILGSYGSDGRSGGTGFATDIIYGYAPRKEEEQRRCFLFGVTYNSYEEPFIPVLRKFRDKYLLTNNPGKKLVKLYYQYGSSAASFIAEHSVLKEIVRIELLPIIGLAYLLVNIDQFLLIFILAFSIFIFSLIRKRWT